MLWNYKDCKIGDQIPTLEIDALQQSDLILYAKASGDHNQIHTDPIFAKKSVVLVLMKIKCLKIFTQILSKV